MSQGPRPWDVLLVGGASGTGKTRTAFALAQNLGVGFTAVDDFVSVLERLTTPEQTPALHFWSTHPNPGSLPASAIQQQGTDIIQLMMPALEVVIANRLEENTPIVLEGDFIHPALAAQDTFGFQPNGGRVRAVFLLEDDEDQLVQNFAEREPESAPQTLRAQVSARWSSWFRIECERHAILAIPVRPWDTLPNRVLEASGI
jgi:2-phosphoglycerate kinase